VSMCAYDCVRRWRPAILELTAATSDGLQIVGGIACLARVPYM